MSARSKTVAAWLAVLLGSLGVHRLYLHGRRDLIGWLHLPPTTAGLAGVLRMRELGQDDRLASVLVVLLGLMLSQSMLVAIAWALTPDERWAARHHPGGGPQRTGWGPVLAAVTALLLGGIVLMGTIAFAVQRLFEWQLGG